MALAIDSILAAGAAANATSLTFAFNNVAGTLLVVPAGIGNSSASDITGVTANGVAMTNAGTNQTWDTGKAAGSLWWLLSPFTGSHNIVVSASGVGGGNTEITASAISYTGNDTTTPIKQFAKNTGSGTATSVALTGVTAGNLCFESSWAGSGMTNDSHTANWVNSASTLSAGGCGRGQTTALTGSITFTHALPSDSWGSLVVEIAAAGGGPTAPTYPELERGLRGVVRGIVPGLARTFVRRDRIFVPAYAVLGDLKAAA